MPNQVGFLVAASTMSAGAPRRSAYQFVYCQEAGHVDRPARAQTLAPALEWLWQDFKPSGR